MKGLEFYTCIWLSLISVLFGFIGPRLIDVGQMSCMYVIYMHRRKEYIFWNELLKMIDFSLHQYPSLAGTSVEHCYNLHPAGRWSKIPRGGSKETREDWWHLIPGQKLFDTWGTWHSIPFWLKSYTLMHLHRWLVQQFMWMNQKIWV